MSAVCVGVLSIWIGLFSAAVGSILAALLQVLGLASAGLARLGTIVNGLVTALAAEKEREPALITFLVTASGITILGIGSAFWGLVIGVLALVVLRMNPSEAAKT